MLAPGLAACRKEKRQYNSTKTDTGVHVLMGPDLVGELFQGHVHVLFLPQNQKKELLAYFKD